MCSHGVVVMSTLTKLIEKRRERREGVTFFSPKNADYTWQHFKLQFFSAALYYKVKATICSILQKSSGWSTRVFIHFFLYIYVYVINWGYVMNQYQYKIIWKHDGYYHWLQSLNIKRAIHSKMLGLFAWHSRCLSVGWLVGRLVDRLVCHNFLSLCGQQKLWITISFVLFRSRQNVQTYNIRRAIFTYGYISLEVQLDYVFSFTIFSSFKIGVQLSYTVYMFIFLFLNPDKSFLRCSSIILEPPWTITIKDCY